MKKFILIDGNNVIHKSQALKQLFIKDKIAARRSLIEKVKTRFGSGCKIEFYFDGHSDSKSSGIFFSGNKTADELIRSRLERSEDHRNFTVVSSDTYITGLAKACGCIVRSSEEFLGEFQKDIENDGKVFNGKNINERFIPDSEKPVSLSRKELDFYRKKFS
ncbi:MAG: NYN domain-containing protein [Ignavibacteria bacterium]|nr:NYN domain-containing protein [Ignavibacteria bacterium]